MHLTAPFPLLRRGRPGPAPAAARHVHRHASNQPRARRSNVIQDRALYHCECGYQWTGEVTASPGCPHCGTPQAW